MKLPVRYTASLPVGFQSGTLELKSQTVYIDKDGNQNQPYYRAVINADKSLLNAQSPTDLLQIVGMGVGDPADASPLDVVVTMNVSGLPTPLRSTFRVLPLDGGDGTLNLHLPSKDRPGVITAQLISSLAGQASLFLGSPETILVDGLPLTGTTYQTVAPVGQMQTGYRDFAVPTGATGAKAYIIDDTSKMIVRRGIYEAFPTDDPRNYMRGRSPEDPAFIGLITLSWGRSNLTYGTYSVGLGHNNTTYGAASLAGGAGSSTGNPDNLASNANDGVNPARGYCALGWGKNVNAYGAKSAALCEETKTYARAGFSAGYYSIAGDQDGSNVGNVALGYRATSIGMYAGAGGLVGGANLYGRGGAVLLGFGASEGAPYANPVSATYPGGVPMIGLVAAGKPVVMGVVQADNTTVYVGIGTDAPRERVETWQNPGQAEAHVLRSGGGDAGVIKYQALKNDGSNDRLTIGKLRWTTQNGQSEVGTVEFSGGSNNPPALVLTTGNLIGIATTTPTESLHVFGNLRVQSGVLKLHAFTKATLPSASASGNGAQSFIGDPATGKPRTVYSDGASWYYTDGTAV